jgi:hypothetical protein
MIDNSRARGLQEMYLAGCLGALEALSEECIAMAYVLVKNQCRKYGLRFDRDRLEELAHDAAAQFIAQYLKHDDYRVENFSGRILKDVQNVMFGRARSKQSCFEDNQANIRQSTKAESNEEYQRWYTKATSLSDLVSEHIYGKKIAADLYRTRNYKLAVRRISAYVEREWLYSHAEALHKVWETFRWRPKNVQCISGKGAIGVCRGVLSGERSERKQPVQRSGTNA